jgi:phosphomannomutase
MIVIQSEILSCQLALEAETSQGKTRIGLANDPDAERTAVEGDVEEASMP